MKHGPIVVLIFAVCLSVSAAVAQNSTEAGLGSTIKSCERCHGTGGSSIVTSTPRLNGQRPNYIASRLEQLLDVSKQTPHSSYEMLQMVKGLDDSARSVIAKYFADQPPTQPKLDLAATAGRQIFEKGVPSRNVLACRLCHGATGEGHAAVPRLAGQHADYLKIQLWIFSSGLRSNRLMHPNTMDMSDDDIEALAAYLGGD